jgi:hypothetical protein
MSEVSIHWGVLFEGKKETLVNSICQAYKPTLLDIRGFYEPTSDSSVTRLEALLIFKIEVSEQYIQDQLKTVEPPVVVVKTTPFLNVGELFD